MKIYEFTDYKKYFLKYISQLPSNGRGQLTKIAKHLDIHTTMVTHIFKGSAHLSLEQSLKLANHFTLNELETDYLVALVQWERAGDKRTKDYCFTKVNDIRTKALNLKERLVTKNELSEHDRAVYYSTWQNSYTRLLTAIDRFQTFESLVEELKLPRSKVRQVLDFLISRGLCKEEGNKIVYGLVPTYIEAASPLAARHHLNWRQKTQEKFDQLRSEDLVFTYPTAISEEDFQKIREKLVQFIEEFKKTTEPSPSENLYCLNIDWLKLSGG